MLLLKEETNKNKSNNLPIQNYNFNDNHLNSHSLKVVTMICKFCDQHSHGKTAYYNHLDSHEVKSEQFKGNPLIIISKN